MNQPRYLAASPLAGSAAMEAPGRAAVHARQRERVVASLIALPASPKPTHRRWG